MKVLFISSGNKEFGISPIVQSQGDSLTNLGIEIRYYTIKGKGFWGYLRNIPKIREQYKTYKPDITHAHYLFSGIIATLSGARPLVVSLMGSDINTGKLRRATIRIFNSLFWYRCIVKSQEMKRFLGMNDVCIIPNGVNINQFSPIDKSIARERLGWPSKNKRILFPANPARKEKNFSLAELAFKQLKYPGVELRTLENIPAKSMPLIYNASDVILQTSLWEGSPNVVKEAMACNVPVVSTDVGDVKEIFEGVSGCFIAGARPNEIAEKLEKALNISDNPQQINSREQIIHKGLNSENIAKRIIDIYLNST